MKRIPNIVAYYYCVWYFFHWISLYILCFSFICNFGNLCENIKVTQPWRRIAWRYDLHNLLQSRVLFFLSKKTMDLGGLFRPFDYAFQQPFVPHVTRDDCQRQRTHQFKHSILQALHWHLYITSLLHKEDVGAVPWWN